MARPKSKGAYVPLAAHYFMDDAILEAGPDAELLYVRCLSFPALVATAGSRFESLEVLRAESGDGRSATVELAAYWRPPVVSLLVPDGVRIEVTAVARSVFG
jgi:hypothetical protein